MKIGSKPLAFWLAMLASGVAWALIAWAWAVVLS